MHVLMSRVHVRSLVRRGASQNTMSASQSSSLYARSFKSCLQIHQGQCWSNAGQALVWLDVITARCCLSGHVVVAKRT